MQHYISNENLLQKVGVGGVYQVIFFPNIRHDMSIRFYNTVSHGHQILVSSDFNATTFCEIPGRFIAYGQNLIDVLTPQVNSTVAILYNKPIRAISGS